METYQTRAESEREGGTMILEAEEGVSTWSSSAHAMQDEQLLLLSCHEKERESRELMLAFKCKETN